MNRLYNGGVLILGNADMIRESQGRKKEITDIKGGLELVRRANYVLHYDEETLEMTILKHKFKLKNYERSNT